MYSLRRYKEEVRVLHGTDLPMSNYSLFDLCSAKENWKDVMGTTWEEWCLPIQKRRPRRNSNVLDDRGLYFSVNRSTTNDLLESADLQDRLLRRVTPKSSLDIERPLIQ